MNTAKMENPDSSVVSATLSENEIEWARAVVVMREKGQADRVVPLPPQQTVPMRSTARAAPSVSLRWDGRAVYARPAPSDQVFVNGKRCSKDQALRSGDEISMGSVHAVVAITDPIAPVRRRALTHAEFRERLAEEVARSCRSTRAASLVMLKAGSGEGKVVLAEAATLLRAGDLIGTYAPDEVEVLLPDTDLHRAETVVQRLAERCPARFESSIVVAPHDAADVEKLVSQARQRLRASESSTALACDAESWLSMLHDPASIELVEHLKSLAEQQRTVLLSGEPHSGKASFARLLHHFSARNEKPCVVVQCGTWEQDGARLQGETHHAPVDEWFARQADGTLVLDEISELPLEVQDELASRLPRNGAWHVTTERALAGLVERGAFRAKLYAHLDGNHVEIPPLRSRVTEILPWAQRFARELAPEHRTTWSVHAVGRLLAYPWHGNLLELFNAVERAMRLAGGGEILAEHLPQSPLAPSSHSGRLREHVDSLERDSIAKALADCNHNQTKAAAQLGISRRTLIYKMERFGLKAPPGTLREKA